MRSAEAGGPAPQPSGLDAALQADPAARRAGAVLHVDLDAAAWNYRRLCDALTPGTECAAVVKANGYGLGVDRVAPTFAAAGARSFFVATIAEGLDLRRVLAEAGWPEAAIYVLNGPLPGTERELLDARLIPVLNSLGDLELWRAAGKAAGVRPPAALHVDSGMSRLGLPDDELDRLAEDPAPLADIDLRLHDAPVERGYSRASGERRPAGTLRRRARPAAGRAGQFRQLLGHLPGPGLPPRPGAARRGALRRQPDSGRRRTRCSAWSH